MAQIRKWYIDRALASYQGLCEVLLELTEPEVLAALELECATLRRKSVVDRLISRAARLHELFYVAQLKEKFRHGTHPQDPDPR